MKFAKAILCLIVTACSVGALTCPEGWQAHLQSCYLPVNQLVEYDIARDECRMRSARVVQVEDAEENQFIVGLLKGASSWMGMRNRHGSWILSDFTPATYTNWMEPQAPRRPLGSFLNDDDDDDDDNDDRECSILRGDSGRWFPVSCDYRAAFVCEITERTKPLPAFGAAPLRNPETPLSEPSLLKETFNSKPLPTAPIPDNSRIRREVIKADLLVAKSLDDEEGFPPLVQQRTPAESIERMLPEDEVQKRVNEFRKIDDILAISHKAAVNDESFPNAL